MTEYLAKIPFHLPEPYQEDFFPNIDDAIRICEDLVYSLRRRRNEGNLISRLPDEILEEIFWNTHDEDLGSIRCIYPSRVCCRWRQVALRSPRLWSYIVAGGGSPRAAGARQLRSKE